MGDSLANKVPGEKGQEAQVTGGMPNMFIVMRQR
jgi:hypothetical protein